MHKKIHLSRLVKCTEGSWSRTQTLTPDIKTMTAMSREYWDHSTPSFLLHETYPINWNTCWALSESSRQHSRKPLSTNLCWNRWSNPCVTWCQPGYKYRQWVWGPSRDLPHSPALIHEKSGVQGTEGNSLSLSSQCQSRKKVKPSFWDLPSLGTELLKCSFRTLPFLNIIKLRLCFTYQISN